MYHGFTRKDSDMKKTTWKLITKNHGFTLMELVFVIAIIAIIGVVAMLSWISSDVNAGGQAKQLAQDIAYTQSLAMSKGARYYLIITGSTTYQIRNASGTPVTLAFGNTTMTLNNGITFGSPTNLPNSLICFDGKGAPYTDTSSPGTALATSATIPLVTSSSTRTVSIAPITGSVSVS